MTIGDRVAHRDGNVGHIEAMDDEYIDVRWLTPRNVPSCCVSICSHSDLTVVPKSVVPQPRSDEWWEQSRAFCAAIENVLIGLEDE